MLVILPRLTALLSLVYLIWVRPTWCYQEAVNLGSTLRSHMMILPLSAPLPPFKQGNNQTDNSPDNWWANANYDALSFRCSNFSYFHYCYFGKEIPGQSWKCSLNGITDGKLRFALDSTENSVHIDVSPYLSSKPELLIGLRTSLVENAHPLVSALNLGTDVLVFSTRIVRSVLHVTRFFSLYHTWLFQTF